MSNSADVKSSERGVVRVFALDYALSMEIGHFGDLNCLREALNVEELNEDDVQIVQLHVIADMGLAAFLEQGYDIALEELKPVREDLDRLTGDVAIIRSGAFGGQPVTLRTDGKARLVATLHEPRPDHPKPMPLDYVGANGTVAGKGDKAVSEAAMSGRVAMVALLVIFALTFLVVWIAS